MVRHDPIRRIGLRIPVFLVITVLVSGSVAFGECPDLIGRVPYGPSIAVATSGTHAYFSSGGVLMIADVSNPAVPIVVGEVELPGEIFDIEVAGGFAHVACYNRGYWMVDVSLPSAPVIVGSFTTSLWATGLDVSGDHVYVTNVADPEDLKILDVSVPGSIQQVGSIWGAHVSPNDVAVSEGYAYVVGIDDGLVVVDVSDPTMPGVVGGFACDGYAVALDAGYAFVAGYEDGLMVFDVSDPMNPVEVDVIPQPWPTDVDVVGGFAYVSAGYDLLIYDVSDPNALLEVGSVSTRTIAVSVSGGNAFSAGFEDGLRIVDVGDPTAPVEVGFSDVPGRTTSVTASGPFVFAGGGEQSEAVRIFDASVVADPVKISAISLGSSVWDVETVGDWLYIATGSSFLTYDVSDPWAPVSHGANGNGAMGIEISGPYAYVASSDGELIVMDISNPGLPTTAGRATLPDHARRVAVSDTHAYVRVLNNGLSIVDVSDPSNPSVVGSYVPINNFNDVAASGVYLYAGAWDGLHILDISNPTAPVEVGRYDEGGGVASVAVSGNFAYIGDGDLSVIDISDPSFPVRIGGLSSLEAAGNPERIRVIGDLVYSAHNFGGFSISRGCHGVFVDGFESGDASAWSSVQPSTP